MTRRGLYLSPETATMRDDKWLWAVRLFYMRDLAATAWQGGAVKIGDYAIKSGRDLRQGEVLAVRQGALHRVVKVVGIPKQRVGASEVPQHLEDLTPAAEFLRVAELERNNRYQRPIGSGKPTKKERRLLGEFWSGREES